jgi:ribosome-binding protein aMBF1 (putative translation factor)
MQPRHSRPDRVYAPGVALKEEAEARRQELTESLARARTTQGPEIRQRLGRRLADARQAHGVFSQRAAADALGVHKNFVWRIEGGQANPSYEVLSAMAFLYELRLEDLLRDCGLTIE